MRTWRWHPLAAGSTSECGAESSDLASRPCAVPGEELQGCSRLAKGSRCAAGVDGEQRRHVLFRTPEIALSVGALSPVHAIQQPGSPHAQGDDVRRVDT
jgi:hypothetical protein